MTDNILIITNKDDITSDFIVKELIEQEISFYRFNTEEITKSISIVLDINSNSYFLQDSNSNKSYDLLRFTSVYYRRPELPEIKNESISAGEIHFLNQEIIFTLEGIYKILNKAFWLSPLYAIRESENKIHQLVTAQEIGFVIPNSLITNSFDGAKTFFQENHNYCIIKPIKSGLIEEGSSEKIIFTSAISDLPASAESIEYCPVFFQKQVDKIADVRVTVVGNKIFATLIESQGNNQTKVDWRKGEVILNHKRITLPDGLEQKCVELLRKLKLQFGAIDFIFDEESNYIFLEINPNGQWAWIEKQTGYEISKEIVNLLVNGKN